LYAFLISPIHATCPSHIIILDVISIIFGENTNCEALLCNFLHHPVTSSLLNTNILLKQPQNVFLWSETQFRTHIIK
jgi:hypothetical protein